MDYKAISDFLEVKGRLSNQTKSDYISKEIAIETIHRYFNELLNLLPTQINGGYEVYLNTERVNTLLGENKALCELIKGLPSADVPERNVGKWEKYGEDMQVCSACHKYWIWASDEYDFKYCPNCGAKMEG